MDTVKKDLEKRMHGPMEVLEREFNGLRTNRAHPSLLDSIFIDAYGASSPLSQVSTVSIIDARTIGVNVWDKSLIKAVEKALTESDLGINPVVEGTYIRIPLPHLSEERRKELVKVAAKYAESARVSIRNIRRDGMDQLKKMEKDSEISEDDLHRFSQDIQKLTDEFIKKIDQYYHDKEKDILSI